MHLLNHYCLKRQRNWLPFNLLAERRKMIWIFKEENCIDVSVSYYSCLVARVDNNSMYLPMKLLSETQKGIEIVEEGFLDCGATGKFIDQNYAKAHGLEMKLLHMPIKAYNVDGTPNKQGMVKSYIDLNIEIHGQKKGRNSYM